MNVERLRRRGMIRKAQLKAFKEAHSTALEVAVEELAAGNGDSPNIKLAAELLGVTRTTIYRAMTDHENTQRKDAQ